jgi:hypothetical protein
VTDLWGMLGALAAVLLPLALAGWLLGRTRRQAAPRRKLHGKMPREEDR